MNTKETISVITGWVALIAISYLSYHFGVLKLVGCIIGILMYVGVGCLVSAFAGDEPKPWLENRPAWLYMFHTVIAVFWLPIIVVLCVWMFIDYGVLLANNIELKKE